MDEAVKLLSAAEATDEAAKTEARARVVQMFRDVGAKEIRSALVAAASEAAREAQDLVRDHDLAAEDAKFR